MLRSYSPSGQLNSYLYDPLGRVTRAINPDGNQVELTYNAYQEVVLARDKERTVEFAYTPLGSLKARTENGKRINFHYNTEEQLVSLHNENREVYRFARDKAGRIIKESGFDGLVRTYGRLPNGLVKRVDRPGKRYSEYIYDSNGRLCGVEYHDGTFEQYSYNKDGQLVEAHNRDTVTRFTRDKLGRITQEYHKVDVKESRVSPKYFSEIPLNVNN